MIIIKTRRAIFILPKLRKLTLIAAIEQIDQNNLQLNTNDTASQLIEEYRSVFCK
jgi:hypothetical protein